MTLNNVGLTLDKVDCVTGDNCSTNKAFANKIGKPLQGCYSHRLSLCASKIVEEFTVEIAKIKNLMVALNNLKNAIVLKRFKKTAIKVYEQRWSGFYSSLISYFGLYHLLTIDSGFMNNVYTNTPTPSEHERLKVLKQYLEQINSVSLRLQKHSCSLSQGRGYFDGLLELGYSDKYTLFQQENIASYLRSDSRIVHSPVFESAIVKLQDNKAHELTDAEKASVACFKNIQEEEVEVVINADYNEDGRPKTVGEMVDSQMSRKKARHNNSYNCVDHIVPTSNSCERLFSQCKLVYSDHRQRMLPMNLEICMYLKTNKHLWDATTVEECRLKLLAENV